MNTTITTPLHTEPVYWQEACEALSRQDKVLQAIIEKHRAVVLTSRGSPFTTLLRAIVGQQISVKAADSVWARVCAQMDVEDPRSVYAHSALLPTCGLSQRKAEYASGIARYFSENDRGMTYWEGLSDSAVIDELIALRGIGRWSAEMFLMFALLRPNVLPLDDLGLLRAMQTAYRRREALTRESALRIAKKWQPWCSVATFYLWRSIDSTEVAY